MFNVRSLVLIVAAAIGVRAVCTNDGIGSESSAENPLQRIYSPSGTGNTRHNTGAVWVTFDGGTIVSVNPLGKDGAVHHCIHSEDTKYLDDVRRWGCGAVSLVYGKKTNQILKQARTIPKRSGARDVKTWEAPERIPH
ncbi:hypothetical protein K438DRAFT_1784701 [Mycena galopus ATCC 62051]|nr:hypothetical protein K438DRAFT_1784701 [Mycena galopus ATCC 62051]